MQVVARILVACGLASLIAVAAAAAPEERAEPATAPSTAPSSTLVRVAIYDHLAGKSKGSVNLVQFLTPANGFTSTIVSPQDLRDGVLKDYDVLIVPGGSGSKQAERIEPSGRENIRNFVKGGGGFVGICAGSYLASSDYTWSLNLLNAKVLDRKHWARGTGPVQLKMTDSGKDALHQADEVEVYYGQGPLLAPDDEKDLPKYEELATYASEVTKEGVPGGVMVGTTAIARAPFGDGRVICFSPHPEVVDGPNEMIMKGVRWAAKIEEK